MPTLTEIAKVAGVSLTTVSMVLNKTRQENRVSPACAERVRAVARELGYIPNYHARSMKLGRAEALAVALDVGWIDDDVTKISELSLPYFGHLIGAIELTARNAGYQLTIVGPRRKDRAPDRGLLGIRQRRFDGMVILGVNVHTEWTSLLAEAPQEPIVVVEFAGQTSLPVVDFDEVAAVDLAVRHLAELGHRRLLWLGDSQDAPAGRRKQLFLIAVQKAGLAAESCHICENAGVIDRERLADLAHAAIQERVAGRDRGFTAVVCYNDTMALGACSGLQSLGLRIPRDVSVIGFDDTEAALCYPRLTSVSHQLPLMGRRAAELLLQAVTDDTARQEQRDTRYPITPVLVVRQSTGVRPG